jgi:predicted PurR-regulated permease PerM
MDRQVVISVKTIFIGALMLLGIYVLYRLGNVIGILLLATLLVFALEPLVKKLTKITFLNKPISRGFAVIFSYTLLILVLIFIATVGIPPVISQLEKMLASLSSISSKINSGGYLTFSLSDFLPQASKFSSGVLSVTISVVSNFTTLVSLLILSLYLSMDWLNIKKQFVSLFPEDREDDVKDILNDIETNVGYWVKGELTLMLVVGLACFAGLQILDVKYPLALGIVSGALEIVPILGPVLSAVLAAIIAFADTPIKGLFVIALYIVIQQMENNILVPKIMQKVSGFSPLVILIALLIGSEFFGVIGAIIAVPTTVVAGVILKKVLRSTD